MLTRLLCLLVSFLVSFSLFAQTHDHYVNQHCKCSDIGPSKMWEADGWLWLNPSDKQASLDRHLPWGVPEAPSNATREQRLVQTHYVINHDGDLRVPTWVAYRLRRTDLQEERERTECFRKDVRLPNNRAGTCADYLEGTYDQGHMVPNSDMERTLRAMLNTYMMSNMTPQHCAFNRGTWLILEKLVRHWATEKREIYIISGTVFDRDGTPGRDPDDQSLRMVSHNQEERVPVPSHFYKILLHEQPDGSIETISFLLPHVDTRLPANEGSQRQHFETNIVSIDDIEQVTGNRFLVDLEQSDPAGAQTVKAFTASSLWPEPTSWPSRLDFNC